MTREEQIETSTTVIRADGTKEAEWHWNPLVRWWRQMRSLDRQLAQLRGSASEEGDQA